MNVAVIGASNKPERYSYKAIKLLLEKGHRVFPVHIRIKDVEGLKVYATLTDIPESIDTITFYVNKDISSKMEKEIIEVKPRRLIFNPGAENGILEEKAARQGIDVHNACTLVLLKIGQF